MEVNQITQKMHREWKRKKGRKGGKKEENQGCIDHYS